jgi:hypothetical protein
VAGVFGAVGAVVAVDLVAVGFGVAVAFGVGVCVGFGLALVVVVVFGVGLVVVVLGLVVGGAEVTVTVGGAVLDARVEEVEELDDVNDPVGSSRGLTARCSAVADVGAATGLAPPPGTVVHAATAASPTTAIPKASTLGGRGRENRTTRRGALRGTSRGSGLVRTVLNSTRGADVNGDTRKSTGLISAQRRWLLMVLDRSELRAEPHHYRAAHPATTTASRRAATEARSPPYRGTSVRAQGQAAAFLVSEYPGHRPDLRRYVADWP